MISFELHGQPTGWQRSGLRVVTPKGKKPFATIYTPAETRKYQDALAWAAKAAMRAKAPFDGPLELTVSAFMAVPPSWPQKKRDAALAGIVRPTGKPDADNFLKQIDALKGITWKDDAQIVDARIVKRYDERPRLRIDIKPCTTSENLLDLDRG